MTNVFPPDWKSCSLTATSFPRSLYIPCSWLKLIKQYLYILLLFCNLNKVNQSHSNKIQKSNHSISLLIQGSFLPCSCGHFEGGDTKVGRIFSIQLIPIWIPLIFQKSHFFHDIPSYNLFAFVFDRANIVCLHFYLTETI